jgi:hypothetical protein
MRRRTLLVVLAGLAVVVAVGVILLWPRADRVTRENYDRIHEGMSRAEVEAILGPPGDYRNGPTNTWFATWVAPDAPVAWQGDRGSIFVYRKGGDPFFADTEPDDPDSVSSASFVQVQRVRQGPLEDLLWRAKRQWHRWFPE